MVQRFVIELGGSQIGHISEDDVAEAVTRLVYQREHGMGSIHIDVQEVPASARLQWMPGYEPVGSEGWQP